MELPPEEPQDWSSARKCDKLLYQQTMLIRSSATPYLCPFHISDLSCGSEQNLTVIISHELNAWEFIAPILFWGEKIDYRDSFGQERGIEWNFYLTFLSIVAGCEFQFEGHLMGLSNGDKLQFGSVRQSDQA